MKFRSFIKSFKYLESPSADRPDGVDGPVLEVVLVDHPKTFVGRLGSIHVALKENRKHFFVGKTIDVENVTMSLISVT